MPVTIDRVSRNLVEISSPVTAAMFKRLSTTPRWLLFSRFSGKPLTSRDWAAVDAYLHAKPDVTLRLIHLGKESDLSFLPLLPKLRHFSCEHSFEMTNWSGLAKLPSSLESLSIGRTRKAVDLSILPALPNLRRLEIEGQHKHLDVVSRFNTLRGLRLRSIKLPNLSILLPLKNLHTLEIKLGGITDLQLLPKIGKLRYLELWHVLGLADVSSVGELAALEHLFLQDQPRVKRLPPMAKLKKLKQVDLWGLKGITDLSPLAQASALKQATVVEAPQLKPRAFLPLKKLKNLRQITVGIGRGNEEVEEMFGLPPVRPVKAEPPR